MVVSARPDESSVRYYLVDRISQWEVNKSIRGVKNVSMTEDFLQHHFPGRPTMPGVLLLESMAQLAGWLEAVSSDFTCWFLIEHVTSCKFYELTGPGDQVEVVLDMVPAAEPDRRRYRGTGTVGGKRRVAAEFEGHVIPLADIEAPSSQRRLFNVLTNAATFSLGPSPNAADR
jgi:3-hydroxyacyl-[acyl-carrier-protein] dehydratase